MTALWILTGVNFLMILCLLWFESDTTNQLKALRLRDEALCRRVNDNFQWMKQCNDRIDRLERK
jgi:hypothetical protein